MLLKYKLNNVCDPKGIRKPHWGGAQITEQFLYTTIYCSCQYRNVKIKHQGDAAKNVIRIISVLWAESEEGRRNLLQTILLQI